MAEELPDLWRTKEDSELLYQLYFCRLMMYGHHERIVTACRQIRRYAARGPGRKKGLFTFFFEINSLCELKDYKAAWRQLRLREEITFGARCDLGRREWSLADGPALAFQYAPVLYFLARYRQGCSLLEKYLRLCFRPRMRYSYDLMIHVYNGDEPPQDRCGVTLSHFYARLGKPLNEWQQWDTFVDGFHPKLFRLAGIQRDELRLDPNRLAEFADNLGQIEAERATSDISDGQRDLIESPQKVRMRHQTIRRQRKEFEKQHKPIRARNEAKLRALFPELRALPE